MERGYRPMRARGSGLSAAKTGSNPVGDATMKTRTCEIRKSFFHYTAASPLKQHEMHPYPFGYLESPLLNIRVPLNHPFCRRRGGCRKVFCRWAVVRTGGALGQCTHEHLGPGKPPDSARGGTQVGRWPGLLHGGSAVLCHINPSGSSQDPQGFRGGG